MGRPLKIERRKIEPRARPPRVVVPVERERPLVARKRALQILRASFEMNNISKIAQGISAADHTLTMADLNCQAFDRLDKKHKRTIGAVLNPVRCPKTEGQKYRSFPEAAQHLGYSERHFRRLLKEALEAFDHEFFQMSVNSEFND